MRGEPCQFLHNPPAPIRTGLDLVSGLASNGHTASSNSLACRNATFLLALILIAAPVVGFRPILAARWRSTLLAALTYGADEFGIAAPSLPAVRGVDVERIAYLTPQQEARLLASYSQWAARDAGAMRDRAADTGGTAARLAARGLAALRADYRATS